MTTMTSPMLGEFREEAAITKRVLDRVPPDKLTWKPHPKSMSLGQLGIHIATVPGALARITQQESFDVSQGSFVPEQPKGMDEIHAAFDQSVREVEDYLKGMTDQKAQASWRLMLKDKEISSRPRISVLRSIMLNHWYHHRGQLSVYLGFWISRFQSFMAAALMRAPSPRHESRLRPLLAGGRESRMDDTPAPKGVLILRELRHT